MSKNIYTTKEYKGYGKQNYYWNEYRQNDDQVEKVKCHRQKSFNGKESNWDYEENIVDSWKTNDSSLPNWLSKYLNKD